MINLSVKKLLFIFWIHNAFRAKHWHRFQMKYDRPKKEEKIANNRVEKFSPLEMPLIAQRLHSIQQRRCLFRFVLSAAHTFPVESPYDVINGSLTTWERSDNELKKGSKQKMHMPNVLGVYPSGGSKAIVRRKLVKFRSHDVNCNSGWSFFFSSVSLSFCFGAERNRHQNVTLWCRRRLCWCWCVRECAYKIY